MRIEVADDLREPGTSRVGESLVMRFGGCDTLARAVQDDGSLVWWDTADGRIVGKMTARHWDLNLRRQRAAAAEGGG